MTMVFMIIKFLECLWVMENVDIGILRPVTLPLQLWIHGGNDDKGGYRSQETSHYSSLNRVARFDVDGRSGYMSKTRHTSSHNPVGCGIFSGISFSSCTVEKNGEEKVGYSVHGD